MRAKTETIKEQKTHPPPRGTLEKQKHILQPDSMTTKQKNNTEILLGW